MQRYKRGANQQQANAAAAASDQQTMPACKLRFAQIQFTFSIICESQRPTFAQQTDRLALRLETWRG